jgi:hypothetical protein
MDFDSLIPIVSIIASAVVALSLIRLWRERHPAASAPKPATISDAQENARLAHENETLRLTVRRLEERMAVLERIATDPAERTAREIEQLR